MKINRVNPDNHKYLQIIGSIAKPPHLLFYRGKLPETRTPSVAIVGSRKPTPYGKEVAYQLAYELARDGVVIISGLALGIDSIAHRAALEAGGATLAVLGNSVDYIYPATHKSLGEQIIKEGGAIISEYEPPMRARDFHFLARNRIISGLADAVVIVEAAVRSGTLNTAAHTLEQGRELFAVPGNITSPLSMGCNNLLKQGAYPATSAKDILDIIAPQLSPHQAVLPLGNTPLESLIIKLIHDGVRDGDQLQQQSGVSATEFSQALTLMEINGTIRALGANQWTLS
jgi:DNA processing protein